MRRATLTAGLIALLVVGASLAAGPNRIAPDEAHRLASSGDLLLIDVRSPDEWRESGVPGAALPITIHGPGGLAQFERDLAAVVERHPGRPVALICAAGSRSARVQAWLLQRGYASVLDVPGGLFGRGDAAGWLAHGLPVEPCRAC